VTRTIIVGTRGSALAQWQTNFVIRALKQLAPDLSIETRIIKTEGDKDQVRPLAEIGGLGVFTKALEDALLAHEIDIAVHSLKDLPTELVPGLTIAAVPEREDPRDCVVSRHKAGLIALPQGARVGTASARRTAQVLALRPDLNIVPLRGNVDTRLRKAASIEYDAIVLAAAGITRLGRAGEITEYLPLEQVMPDPGQGALAVEIRGDDAELAELVGQLDHAPTRAAVTAERAFLRALGGGCRMPIGAFGRVHDDEMDLQGLVASIDGKQIVRGQVTGRAADAEMLGTRLAVQLLIDGAGKILGLAPLSGKRILVTRAREQAEALSDKIRMLGGDPVELPAIDLAPLTDYAELDAALSQTGNYDWVVFTSANGVRAVAERLAARGLDASYLASAKLAAIGPATARALQALGLAVEFIPTKYLGEQVAAELPVEPGSRALLLRADLASDVLARGLTERGVQVKDIDAYRTILPETKDVDWKRIDAVTFTSSSTVNNMMNMLGDRKADLARADIFCIGPVTAQTAREAGLNVAAVATEHTVDGLLAAMVEYYAKGNHHA
jgi:hydroxymethylbilane synthase